MRPTTIDGGQVQLRKQARTLGRLLPYLWPRGRLDLRLRVLLAVALLIAAKLANVYVPLILRAAVDTLTPQDATLLVVPLALLLAYGAARVGAQAFGELRDAIFARVAQNAIRALALETFRHLHRLSLRFHLERQTGGLSRAIERGTKGIEFLLSFVLFNIVPTLVEIALVCGILWYIFDWRFPAIAIVTIVVYVWFTFAVTERRIVHRRHMNEADSEANSKAIDSLLNFETVKYFGNEEHEARRYDVGLRRYEAAAVKSRTSLSLLNVGQNVVISAGVTGIMLLTAFGVVQGSMTVGDFIMVNAYLIQVAIPLNLLGTVYREIKQSLVDMEVLFDLVAVAPEVTSPPGAPPLRVEGGAVTFDKVDFGYDARRPILHEVSFTVPAGKTVAIVGPSGAGKSTISRLLFRFYDVTGGRILIDGQDIRQVDQASLRAAIGIVPQDTVLFNDSIRYNIAYGRPGASQEAIVEAARLARIHDFITGLPEGYDTQVGERGLKLSGGEKQRVAIARTLLKGPAIFLFDEATSSLDSKTERQIQTSLREVSRDRTTLIIAHRLSTVIEADEIIVLEAGRIVERGRHAELLALNCRYAEMWRRQQAGDPERAKEVLVQALIEGEESGFSDRGIEEIIADAEAEVRNR
ncbi:MAG: ABCB family ABC transporter ATP-binding protein/permease [Kiloniellales bacterium]